MKELERGLTVVPNDLAVELWGSTLCQSGLQLRHGSPLSSTLRRASSSGAGRCSLLKRKCEQFAIISLA
eukprot:8238904-Pyramimonas_sp.AAC.1